MGGIALMVLSFVVFAGIDSCAKFLGATLPVGQVVFLRYIFALIYAVIFMVAMGALKFFKTAKPGRQIWRGGVLAMAT